MKSLRNLVLISSVLFFTQLFFPWWIISPVCILAGFFLFEEYGQAALLGFCSAAIPWVILSFLKWNSSNGILMDKVGLMLGGTPGWSLILIVSTFAGILGLLSSCLGYSLVRLKK